LHRGDGLSQEGQKKKKWWGKNPLAPKEKVTTEKDIGVPDCDAKILVGVAGKHQEIIGDYYPEGEEFLIAEKQAVDPEREEWILYRKKFNDKTGEDEVTEHIRVNVRQLSRVVMMHRYWDEDELEEGVGEKEKGK
jgi:hypothetical protein